MRLTERIHKGMKWLDENRPGWHHVVDADAIRDGGSIKSVLPIGDASPEWAEEHGFDVKLLDTMQGGDISGADENLRREWVHAIEERRGTTSDKCSS